MLLLLYELTLFKLFDNWILHLVMFIFVAMMQALINHIETIVKLSEQAKLALYELAKEESFARNTYILNADERCRKIWFIVKGMVRKYHLRDGEEITTWIHAEGEIFTALQSYAQNIPSDEYIQACEDTLLISISKDNSAKLADLQEFMVYSSVLMEREFVNIDKHTKEMQSRDAKAKYDYLKHIAPEITKRAKLGHIASVLGITRETLSRIRAK